MDNSHRKEFDAQIMQLCAGFPPTFASPDRIEAYWRALQKMPMSGVVRCVDYALSEDYDEDRIPSPRQLWRIYRQLRARSVSIDPSPKRAHDDQDIFTRFADHVFFNYLMRKGCALEVLPRLIDIKNTMTKNYRDIGSEEHVDPQEMRDQLVKRWDKVHKPAASVDLQKSLGTFNRLGVMYVPEKPQIEIEEPA
jgi:hypothetical protein